MTRSIASPRLGFHRRPLSRGSASLLARCPRPRLHRRELPRGAVSILTGAMVLTLLLPDAALAGEERPPHLTLLRVDVEDGFALHPWIYHEVRLSKRWGILGDVNVQAPGLNGRFPPFLAVDVGPNLHLGPLQVSPQIGVDLIWKDDADGGQTHAGDLVLQLYLILTAGRLAAESWNLYFIPFDGANHFFQMRQLITARVVGGLSLGPRVEGTFVVNQGTDRLALGGDLGYAFSWGQLSLFLASERMRGALETRLTYVREL